MNKQENINIKLIQEKINFLEKSIDQTRQDFLIKIAELNLQLEQFRQVIPHTEHSTIKPVNEQTNPVNKQTNLGKHQSINDLVSYHSETDATLVKKLSVKKPSVKKPSVKKPSIFSLFFSKLMLSIIGFIFSSLSIFSTPFQDLFHKFKALYFHYQKQGKAPVFLMTVAGLITLSFGFAYLLQYLFDSLFNDTLKALTGFIIGAGIITAGILLARKKTVFQDYAASVIALGIIFNYLTAYFVGPYYGYVSETTGLILLLSITLISFSLAVAFETKVISAVTLVGGIFMPFMLGGKEPVGTIYLVYLFFLTSGNLYLSQRIKWPSLAQIAFVSSLSVIEYVGISGVTSPYIALSLLSGFFYIYTYYWSFNKGILKQSLSKQDLTILVSNLFYFIYALLQIPDSKNIIACLLFVHALVFVFLIKKLAIMQSKLAPIYLLIIGLLIATTAFVLMPTNISSIIWSIEGLAMLYLGFKFSQIIIRSEAYAIYLIAMLSLLWQAFESFNSMSHSLIAWHWINMAAFGLFSLLAYRIIYSFKEHASWLEKKIAFIQNEIFTLWGAISLSLIIIIYTPAMTTILVVIPMLWCFYRVSQFRLRFAQISAYFFYFIFIVQLIIALIETNKPIISQQSVITWIALFETLFFAWALHFYYQYFNLTGKGEKIARKMHHLFFYAPITLTSIAVFNIYDMHILEQYALTFGYLWIDFIIIAVLLVSASILLIKFPDNSTQQQENYHYILSETQSFFATIFFLYTVILLLNGWGLEEWVFNTTALPLILLMYRGLKDNLPLTEKLAWAHFLLFALMTLISYQTIGNLHFSEQTWATRLGWIELLLCAWLVQSIYQQYKHKQCGHNYAKKLRIAVYLLIPLLFLPRIIRLYPDFIPVALWLSFTISWLMYKKLKIPALVKELSLLFFLAIISSILVSLNALTGGNEMPGLVALMTGILVLNIFHYVEKTLSLKSVKDSIYYPLHITSPYYFGFVIASICYALTHQILIFPLVSGLYFTYILQQTQIRIILRESIRLAYLFSWQGLMAVPIMTFMQLSPPNIITIALNIVALIGLWYLTHSNSSSIIILLKKSYAGQNKQLWLFHANVLLAYISSLNLIFTPWAVATSLFMLIHAVVLLFLTLSNKYQGLLGLSIILYALTAVKVLFHDMNDFTNSYKIIALMGIGSILMFAAFIFQKLQKHVTT